MKKLTQNQLQLLVLLFMLIIVVIAYRFGFMKFNDQAQLITAQNQQLQNRLAELEQKEALRESYETGLTDAKAQLEAIYSKYGPGNTPEKSILFVNKMEQEIGMTVSNLAFSPETSIYNSAKLREDNTPAVSIYISPLTIDFTTGYEGLKSCMDHINQYKERMNVESFNAVYDQETGLLKGSMIINQYSLLKEGSSYVNPVISDILLGTDNIFSTINGQ